MRTQHRRPIAAAALACLSLCCGAALWLSTADDNRAAARSAPRAPVRAADSAASSASTSKPSGDGRRTVVPHRGMAIQLTSNHEALATYVPLLREVAQLGANTVLLSVAGEMEHAKAQRIYIDARKSPGPRELESILQEARRLGLDAYLMPIVLLSHPRGTEWRGQIDPPDWDTWWRDYREFLLHFADIAHRGQAAGMLVGSELVSTERYTDEWVRCIAAVRERYGGSLGYSANWDHYKPIKFWDKLDFVGMTSYYTLADRANPTVEEIVQRWRPIRDGVLAWADSIGKPILMTEVGWCSQEGAAKAPWNYYQNQKATPAGHEEQRRLYEAFIQVWGAAPELTGVIWWEWTAAPGGENDFGYSPKNKPAERLLRDWFAAAADAERQSTAQTGNKSEQSSR